LCINIGRAKGINFEVMKIIKGAKEMKRSMFKTRVWLVIFILFGMAGILYAQGKVVIGYVTYPIDQEYWVNCKKFAEEVAKELGVTLLYTPGRERDTSNQLDIINDFITQKVDVVIVTPMDAAGIVPGIKKLNAAGIPVLGCDNIPKGGDMIATVQGDAYAGGQLIGQFIWEKSGHKPHGKLFNEMPETFSEVAYNWKHGGEDFLKQKGWTVLEQPIIPYGRTSAMEFSQKVLLANPDLDAYYSTNDDTALGTMQTLKSTGKKSKIILCGYNALEPAVVAIKAGDMDGTVFQDSRIMVRMAIELAKVYKSTPWTGTIVYKIPPVLVTKETVAWFEKKFPYYK